MIMRAFAALLLLAAAAAIAIGLHIAFTEGDTVFSWKRPDNLGVKDGRLAPCKRTPNCVASQADPSDAQHFIDPLRFEGAAAQAMAALRRTVEGMARTRIILETPNYLYAEFRSKLLGYVDDVEFVVDERAGVIQVRSASRLGRRDFGVNRARIEAIRKRFGRGGSA
jgi:uncharacterized protein (DUF1499 family)